MNNEYDIRSLMDYFSKKDKVNLEDQACMDLLLKNVMNYLYVFPGTITVTRRESDGGVTGVILNKGFHFYCRTLSKSGRILENVYGFSCQHERCSFVSNVEMPYGYSGICVPTIARQLASRKIPDKVQHIIFQTSYYPMKEMEKIFRAVQRDIGLPVSERLLKIETSGSDPDCPYDLFQLLDGYGYIIAHAKRWYVDMEICSSQAINQPKMLFHFGKVAKIQYVFHLV